MRRIVTIKFTRETEAVGGKRELQSEAVENGRRFRGACGTTFLEAGARRHTCGGFSRPVVADCTGSLFSFGQVPRWKSVAGPE